MSKILSLLFLIAAVALLVITYFFPFFTYNVGTYKGEMLGQEVSISFNFKDECTITFGEDEYKGKYEIKDGEIIITDSLASTLLGFNNLKFENSYTLVPQSISGDVLECKFISYVGIGFTAIYAFVGFISLIVFIVKLVK